MKAWIALNILIILSCIAVPVLMFIYEVSLGLPLAIAIGFVGGTSIYKAASDIREALAFHRKYPSP